MRRIRLSQALILLLAASSALHSQTQPQLAIVVKSERAFSPASFREMQREFEAIMASIAHVEWRMVESLSGGEAFDAIVVTNFTGSCEIDESWFPGWVRRNLAKTYGSREALTPFPDIDCDAVRAMLTGEIAHRNVSQLQTMLGQGLARILAHEVYHILLNTPGHSARGIAKQGFTPSDLFTGTLRFEPKQAERMSDTLSKPQLMLSALAR